MSALTLALPALVMGLVGSTHCAVMCGGVAAATCRKPKASLGWNAGRVATYTLLGALAGAATGLVPFFAVALRPLAAIALVALGLHLMGVSSVFRRLEAIGAPVWRRVEPLTRRPLHAALLGAAWGFVPCGLLYTALAVAAATGSAEGGALTMAAFGLGTLPVMATIGALSASMVRAIHARGRASALRAARAVAGVLVLALGIHQTTLAFAAVDLRLGGAQTCHTHAH